MGLVMWAFIPARAVATISSEKALAVKVEFQNAQGNHTPLSLDIACGLLPQVCHKVPVENPVQLIQRLAVPYAVPGKIHQFLVVRIGH